MLQVSDLHARWMNKDNGQAYAVGEEKSRFLYDFIAWSQEELQTPMFRFKEDVKVLELGCNSGRNLAFFKERGFYHLYGVDINASAIALKDELFKDLSCQLECKPIEQFVAEEARDGDKYDLVFSVATLGHIHPDCIKDVVSNIVKIIQYPVGIFACVECNSSSDDYEFAHDYKGLLKNAGLELIAEQKLTKETGFDDRYTARIFVKRSVGMDGGQVPDSIPAADKASPRTPVKGGKADVVVHNGQPDAELDKAGKAKVKRSGVVEQDPGI